MSYYKNILIFIKKSKLNYLLQKYGEAIKNSSEFDTLNESMKIHSANCDHFINILQKHLNKDQKYEIFYDDFEKYSQIDDLKKSTDKYYDLVFSLGGDGTFLRSIKFNKSNYQLFVGVNTDGKNSKGFYCYLNSSESIEENLKKIFENKYSFNHLNKLNIEINRVLNKYDKKKTITETYNFINDLYFGEKFMGRISKYELNLEEQKKNYIIKSSGLIVSTFMGYSGWIRNANTISFNKFENMIKIANHQPLKNSEILELYNNKVYIPNYENENSIFYFVREPGIKNIKNFSDEQDYIEYLKFMEGSVKSLKIKNFCYDGILILDGTFTIPLLHEDLINVKIGENKVKTIKNELDKFI